MPPLSKKSSPACSRTILKSVNQTRFPVPSPSPEARPPLSSGADALDRSIVDAFLKNVPYHVYFKDRDSRFIALSASMVRLFGRQHASEIIGKSDFDFFAPAHAQPAFDDEQAIIRTGQPIIEKIEKETWPDGHVTWVSTSKMPLRNPQGEIVGTLGLSKDITAEKNMEQALEVTRKELMDASRMTGMAEVATGVLHNVGNVLNSLNVSATVLANGLRQSKAESLGKVATLLQEHAGDLELFLTRDPKGMRVPELLASLARHGTEEHQRLLQEIEALQKNVDHIKEIVSMQQNYATTVGLIEPLDAAGLMEDALRMNRSSLARHDVRIQREFDPVPPVLAERGKVLQILINLIRNSKFACDDGPNQADKVITLRVRSGPPGRILIDVQDNGIGIPAENLTRIFNHGFTTRAQGHGFGLHSSANAASELHGSLTVHSAGPGTGATFTLELPAAPVAVGDPS